MASSNAIYRLISLLIRSLIILLCIRSSGAHPLSPSVCQALGEDRAMGKVGKISVQKKLSVLLGQLKSAQAIAVQCENAEKGSLVVKKVMENSQRSDASAAC